MSKKENGVSFGLEGDRIHRIGSKIKIVFDPNKNIKEV
jgi:hypothetical protein